MKILTTLKAKPSSDGAGVSIKRVAAMSAGSGAVMDPFLMLDELRSQKEEDFIAGFPPHPHRGFETITYLRHGGIEHEDHLGNSGRVEAGGVQWMTAGKGVVHSEMPFAGAQGLHGFQLWLNLPAGEKLRAPEYRDIRAQEIPELQSGQSKLRVLAGELSLNGKTVVGPIGGRATEPGIYDIQITSGSLTLPVQAGHRVLLYVYDGQLEVGSLSLNEQSMLVFESDSAVELRVTQPAGLLWLSGRPLNEPIAQYGPFVMNTREEIEQAIQDYQSGRLTD